MPQTLEVPGVPDELVQELDTRLRGTGQDRSAYLIRLLERDLRVPTLSQVLAPFRAQVAASGISEVELNQLFQEAREEAPEERQGQPRE